MITVWNRKVVFITFSMESQAKVRDILEHNGIRYYVKVVNRRSASPLGNGTRSRMGSFGEDSSFSYEYIFYVHRKDFELADKWVTLRKG